MGLTSDEIMAVTIVCLFYIVLLGHYFIRLSKKWCNRKKKVADTDIEAQNENTTTQESSSPSESQSPSSPSLRESTDIVATNNPATATAEESPSVSNTQSSSDSLEQMPKSSRAITKYPSSASDIQPLSSVAKQASKVKESCSLPGSESSSSSTSVVVQVPKPCVLAT